MSAKPFTYRHTVEFRDLDAVGHVNNAAYFAILETARLAFWTHLTGAKTVEDYPFIMARAECDYETPAFFLEALEISVWPSSIGTSSFAFDYRVIAAASGRLVAKARTVQVHYNYQTGKPEPLTEPLRRLLEGAGRP